MRPLILFGSLVLLVSLLLPVAAAGIEEELSWCSEGASGYQTACYYWFCDPYDNCHQDYCLLWDGNQYKCVLDPGL